MLTSTFRPSQKLRLGEVLIQLGYLDEVQLIGMLKQARASGITVGQAAVTSGVVTEAQVMAALSRQIGLPYQNLDAPDVDCIALFPAAFVQKHRAVAIERGGTRGGDVVVALAAPARLDTQDAVRAVLATSRVRFVLASDAALDRALVRLYGNSSPKAPNPTPPAAPPVAATVAAPKPVSVEAIAALELNARTLDVLAREAGLLDVTPREIIRRLVESWAPGRRQF